MPDLLRMILFLIVMVNLPLLICVFDETEVTEMSLALYLDNI